MLKQVGLTLLLLTASAFAQTPALIAHTGSPTGATPAANTTGANFAVICGRTGTTITDSMGNNWVPLSTTSIGGYAGSNSQMYAAFALRTSATHTFTATNGTAITVMAFSNIASGPDQAAVQGSPSSSNVGPITPTKTNEVVVGCFNGNMNPPQTVAPTATVNSPYTVMDIDVPANSDAWPNGTISAYAIFGAASTTEVDFTTNARNGSAESIAGFYSKADAPVPVIAVADPLPEASVGAAYTATACPSAHAGVEPYVFTVTGVPAGMTYSTSTGCVSGTPSSTVTDAALTFTLTDQASQTATASSHISVASAPITLAGTSCPVAKQLQPYSCSALSASGGIGTLHYSNSTDPRYTGLPGNLNVNTSSGLIYSDRVMDQGDYSNVGFSAYDDHGGNNSVGIDINIDGDNTFGGVKLFPDDAVYHLKVRDLPNDTSIRGLVPSYYSGVALKAAFAPPFDSGGMPINTLAANTPFYPMVTDFGGNQFTSGPFPCTMGIESGKNNIPASELTGGIDVHALGVYLPGVGADGQTHPAQLYESYNAYPIIDSSGNCSWGNPLDSLGGGYGAAVFPAPGKPDKDVQTTHEMPNPDATVDAAGLPITPLLVNYDEVAGGCAPGSECGVIRHPIRMSVQKTSQFWQWPASSSAPVIGDNCPQDGYSFSDHRPWDQAHPPTCLDGNGNPITQQGLTAAMAGQIFHLPPGTAEPAACSSNPVTHIVFEALIDYGVIIADNGLNGNVMGTPDHRWPDWGTLNHCLNAITLGQMVSPNVSVAAVDSTYQSNQIKPQYVTATALTFSSTSLPNGQVGSPYSFPFSISGGSSPYTCTRTGGTLPAGVTLNSSTCTLGGTPTTAGTTTGLVFTATDSTSATASSASLSLTVAAAASTLAVSTTSLPAATAGTPYSFALTATGGTVGGAAPPLSPSQSLTPTTNYYVSLSGNDANPGTLASPWLTIQHAMNVATPGSTVNIRAGTYHERLTVNVSGTAGHYITFQPYGFAIPSGGCGGYTGVTCGGEQVILDYAYLGTVTDGVPLVMVSGKSYVTIQGLTFQNLSCTGAMQQGIRIDSNSSYIEFNENKFLHNKNVYGGGIDNSSALLFFYVWPSTNVTVNGNEFGDLITLVSEALTIEGGSGTVLEYNYIHDVDAIAIDSHGGSSNYSILANHVEYAGIKRSDGSVWYNNPPVAIYNDGGSNGVMARNIVSHAGTGYEALSETGSPDTHDITISDNIAEYCVGEGIVIGTWYSTTDGSSVYNIHIYNNTFWNNAVGVDILPMTSASVTWENNIIANNTTNYYNSLGWPPGTTGYNLYYGADVGPGANNVTTDPLFVNAAGGNFGLQAGSPAINVGDPATSSTYAGTTDFAGNARVQSGRIDIGANEYGTASGGYTWAKTSGTLPSGITLASSGTLSGTATAAGTFAGLVFRATDALAATASSAPLSLTVNNVASPLTVTTTSLPNGMVGANYTPTQLAATGGTGPYTWTNTGTVFPPGLIVLSSGSISGTPTAAGTYAGITFRVTDALGATANTGAMSVVISPAPTVATPTCSPAAGTYTGTQTVTCSSTTPSSITYCTVNGSNPSPNSPVCSGISVAASLTLKAISTAAGDTNSAVLSQAYTINSTPPPTGPHTVIGGAVTIGGNVVIH